MRNRNAATKDWRASRKARTAGLLAAGMAAVLTLAACSGNTDGGGGDGSSAVFVEAVGTNPPHLNPQLATDITTNAVAGAVFEHLVGQDATFEIIPELAESWEISEDGMVYTLHLREGVTWHDGEPFTAEDVKFNLEEVIPLNPLGPQLTDKVASVEATDEHTVVLTLSEPFAPVLEALTNQYMIPKHLYEGTDITVNPANMAPVGTGPYQFNEFNAGERITVTKYPDYWQEAGAADTIVFTIIPDNNARMLALRGGDVDRISPFFTDQAQVSSLSDEEFFVTTSKAAPSVMTAFLNVREGELADPGVRHAVLSAIDRDAIAESAFSGSAIPARGPIPAAMEWAVDPEVDFTVDVPFDPEAAAAELDELGYPIGADGSRFELDINYAGGLPTFASTAEMIKSNLEAIGIRANLVQEDLNIFTETTFTTHDFDIAVMGFASYADPNLGVSRLYVCNPDNVAFLNATGMCDAELDAAFAGAAEVADRAQRAEFLSTAERRAEQLLHTLPLAEEQPRGVMREGKWGNLDEFAHAYTLVDWTALTLD
ncbi:ABC transporter substrate-binding protein [Agromyces aerolatus]|uniref:ABC transporter substrate-binding protein n=1 Tax=Agromyces sp. LY-1074 TaxID=3074080 RepID=UPI002863E625|nr:MULTISPECIES: ABC transporter substrate-binding protein [unclassified Agromyces]MDR5699462.1 ABC transporter substrate-binding protein [Agromyces sp. LY-1074]MDR5705758.1 ABC transporter substrate-binding protein [Agromyces sp. LY-1358]